MNSGPRWEPEASPAPPAAPQPMRLGQVLEVGVRILRRQWPTVLIVALLIAGPGALLSSATGLRFTQVATDILGIEAGLVDADTTITQAELERALDALVPYLLATVIAGVLLSIGTLVLSAVVAEDYHARSPHLGGVLRRGLRRAPSAIGFIILTSLITIGVILVGLLGMSAATLVFPTASVTAGGPGVFLALVMGVGMVVALVYLTMRWAPAFPAMVEEDLGVREAFRRSWQLSGDNVWRILFIIVLASLTAAIGASVLSQLFALVLVEGLAPLLGLDEGVAETVAIALGSILLAPLLPVLTAVLYFDLRARRDPATPAAQPGIER
mgnify:FL=1